MARSGRGYWGLACLAVAVTNAIGPECFAAGASPVSLCDLYAASPLDPNRNADGVSIDRIDASRAIPACEKAVSADPANPRLLYQLARAYTKIGDHKAAFSRNEKAAQLGYAAAQYNLAVAYERALGTAQDFAEAIRWYKAAASQGVAGAQANLGEMYASGNGVAIDYGVALKWFSRAAGQGDTRSQTAIGEFYEGGLGVAKNIDEAERWWRMAASKGNPEAQRHLDELASLKRKEATPAPKDTMNDQEVEAAIAEARACIRSNIPGAYASGVYGREQAAAFFSARCYPSYSAVMQRQGSAVAGIADSSFQLFIIQEIYPDEWKALQEKIKQAAGH